MAITTIKRKDPSQIVAKYYATGKRKNASARVWLSSGNGKISVNGKDVEQYFARQTLRTIICQPLTLTNSLGQYDVRCTVSGGGLTGQAGATRHGISKALDLLAKNPDIHSALREAGFLTRDSREVERKKYGKKKARKRFQFSKR